MALKIRKSEIIKAINGSGGYMSNIANRLNVDWHTAKKYVNQYNLHSLIEAENERLNDVTEMKLLENIKNNDTTAIIFRLKTRAKDRGYDQSQDINLKIQPYNPNLITYEQRQELINESVKLLCENINNTVNNAEMIDYEEDVQNIIG